MARNIVRHNFRDIAGGAVKQNLAGPVIGELGTVLAETDIPELAEPLKNKPEGLAELNDAIQPPSFTVDPIQLENAGGIPELGTVMPRRQPSIQKPPAASPGKGNPYSDPRALGSLIGDVNFATIGANFPSGPHQQQQQQQQAGPTNYSPPNLGSGAFNAEGRLPGASPFKRVSAVRFKQEDATQVKSPGYLGASKNIRGAAAAGYNAVVARHEYKRQVWADKAAEADEEMGKLQVEPSGVTAWDASVENMAREWKGELAGLLQNKENLDPNEFVAKKQEILKRSQDFSSASQQLQKVVADYNENLDNISASTDPETLDLLNTLNKGGGAIGVSNVNGVPTLSGITNGGQQVSVPIGEIASGRNAFRFNVQSDVTGSLNKISDGLGKLKRDIATRTGVSSQSLPWEQVQGAAEEQVNGILNNNASVRSILADKYGYDHDDYTEMFGQDSDAAREFAKEQLMGTLQEQHQPRLEATTIKKHYQPKQSGAGTAGERNAAQSLATANQVLTKDFNYSDPASYAALGYEAVNPETLNKDQRKAISGRYPDGKFVILNVDGKAKVIPTGGENTRAIVAKSLYGVDPTQLSPLKRSPFKRFKDWMTK